MYDIQTTCSSSPENTDDISLFLRQILLKSSPSIPTNKQTTCNDIPQLEPVYSSGLYPIGAYVPVNAAAAYVSSSSAATIDNDIDEYDCESEEGYENMMDKRAPKSTSNRNSSKRTRAAEVHNMSEKRRRNRINEKMKALQKLIPNSNKTDKASMLDEAIEYLKQLQLRVQMLTMRNGINLYSMSVPHGVLEPNQPPHSRIELNEATNMMSLNQEMQVNPMLSAPLQFTSRNQLSIPDFSHTINPGPSSSFRECLINSNELMNSNQNLVFPVVLDGGCSGNGSYENTKR